MAGEVSSAINLMRVRRGSKVRIQLLGRDETVQGTVTAVLRDGHIRAAIDPEHELHLRGEVREITVSPDLYEEL